MGRRVHWTKKACKENLQVLKVVLELTVNSAAVFFFLERLALVEGVLTASKIDVQFGTAILVDEKECGDDGEAGALGALLEAMDLTAIEEEFAVTAGGVVVVGAVEVLGDIHVLDPNFTANDGTISIHQTGLTKADALDFGASEDESCGVFLHQVIVKLGLAVLDVDGLLFFFCHS